MGVIYKNLGFLGFPLYEVGNDGSVMSLKWAKTNTKHLLTPGKSIYKRNGISRDVRNCKRSVTKNWNSDR